MRLTNRVNTFRVLIFVGCCGLFSSAALAQSSRLITPADILRIATVSDAQISPNGEWIVYSVSTVEGEQTNSMLWLVRVNRRRVEGREPTFSPVALLPPGWSGSNPRWSPDSSMIAFLANREGVSGIWLTSPRRDQPRFIAPVQFTNFFITYAGESISWSPDSKRLAYISATEETEAETDPRVISRIQYKSRTSFSDNRRTHVFVVSVDKPEPRQLTTGMFYDHAVAFSPRNEEIAFLSNREPDPDANNNSDIYAVDVGGQIRQITETKGSEYEPAWSPDGKFLAYTATKRDITTIDSVAEDAHVWITSASGDKRSELTEDHNRRARSPRWSPDGRAVFYLAGDRGLTTVFAVSVSGGSSRQLLPDLLSSDQLLYAGSDAPGRYQRNQYQVSGFTVAHSRPPRTEVDGATDLLPWPIAFTLSTSTMPAEVWVEPALNYGARRASSHNTGFARAYSLGEPAQFSFKSFDGATIQGWLLKPAGFRSDRRYPLILSIHGGPHGMFGWGFNSTFQAYAARGYAVLFINPRGSSGYGQKFSDGTLNEWGGGDYKDLMAGLDEALRRNSWIDANRMGVTGGSYGGFMTNWIITQTPRFRAAVASASVSNLVSFYATSLYQDLIHAEFGGYPWDNYELLWSTLR